MSAAEKLVSPPQKRARGVRSPSFRRALPRVACTSRGPATAGATGESPESKQEEEEAEEEGAAAAGAGAAAGAPADASKLKKTGTGDFICADLGSKVSFCVNIFFRASFPSTYA